jgi:hypothetical protein
MRAPSRWLSRALLRLYPADVRRRTGEDLEAAFVYCVARERERHGRPGVAYAWARLVIDAIATSVQLRLDRRRTRRIARQHTTITPGEGIMGRLSQDIRYAARSMRRAPLFSAVVVLTLGLAIGATTAVFTIVNAVLLRSLPYRNPEGLVVFYERIGKGPGTLVFGFSAPDYVAFRERVTSLESIAAYAARGCIRADGAVARRHRHCRRAGHVGVTAHAGAWSAACARRPAANAAGDGPEGRDDARRNWSGRWVAGRVDVVASDGIAPFRSQPRDPLAFAGAAALMGIVAVAASGIPAWRATRVEPISALRRD